MTAILAAACLLALPAQGLFAQGETKTNPAGAAGAPVDYNALYSGGIDDYNAQRNLEAMAKFTKVLRKYPKHIQSQRYLSLLRQRLREEASVPLMKRRLRALVLEDAAFEDATLAEVMEYVTLKAKELSKGEVKPGLVIRGGDPVRDRMLTFKIGAVPLDTLIDTVAKLTNTTANYTDYAITFTPLPTAEEIAAEAARQLDQAEAKERARSASDAEKSDPFRNR